MALHEVRSTDHNGEGSDITVDFCYPSHGWQDNTGDTLFVT